MKMEWTSENVSRISREVFFVMSLFITALERFIVLSPIYTYVFILRYPCAQWFYDILLSTWYAFVVALYEQVLGVKIVIQGDVTMMGKTRSSLIIMNHRMRLDWLFFFSVHIRYGSQRRFKIALKNEMRHLPGAGWAMQAAHFVFLEREWDLDRLKIENTLVRFKRLGYRPQLLLFPEGTDLRTDSKETSDQYAVKNCLANYEYVLHTRTMGFVSLVNLMHMHNDLEQVIDVTVAYPQNVPQSEMDVLCGDIPKTIVYTVNCFDFTDLPTESEHLLAQWLEERCFLNEAFLKKFYESKEYTSRNGYASDQRLEIEGDVNLHLFGALLFWSGLTIATGYLLLRFIFFRWFFLCLALLSLLISTVVGLDSLMSYFHVSHHRK